MAEWGLGWRMVWWFVVWSRFCVDGLGKRSRALCTVYLGIRGLWFHPGSDVSSRGKQSRITVSD